MLFIAHYLLLHGSRGLRRLSPGWWRSVGAGKLGVNYVFDFTTLMAVGKNVLESVREKEKAGLSLI